MEDDDLFPEMAMPSDIQHLFTEFQKSFGFLDIGAFMKDSFFEPPSIRDNPRDEMLKVPEKEKVLRPNFEHFWSTKKQPELQMDSDIDDEVKDLGILNFDYESSPTNPASQSFFKSVSVRTIRTADGKMEEHRTVKDSTGKIETTVRKVLGDQSIETKIMHDKDGFKEKIDNYINVDENSISEFQKRFNGNATLATPMLKYESEVNQPNTFFGLFKNLFQFPKSTD